jgi:hypothetical protein
MDNQTNTLPTVETLKIVVSLLATCIGLAVIVIGLNYAMDIFQLIFTLLKSPAVLTDPIGQLAASFGGTAFDLKLSDRTIPVAKMIALVIYCFGLLIGAFLTMALMQTGAKIVALTAGDRSAVKQLLQSAFGSKMQPKPGPEEKTPRT